MQQHRVRSVRRTTRAALVTAVTMATAALGVTTAHATPAPDAPVASTAADPGLREVSGDRFIGTAVNDNLLSDPTYTDILDTEFNSVTAENVMKWDATEPSQGQFDFTAGDRLVEHAQANGQKVYGHTLVWHSQAPGWAQGLQGEQLRSAMINHVTEVVSHYRGQVERWDVVNEVLSDGGGFRDSFLYQQLGEDFIADAFRAAAEADPDAKLFINDYNTTGINAKSDTLYQLVQDLLAEGVPVHGVGFQSHEIVGQIPGDIQQNLQRFADLGLEVVITELDIRTNTPASEQALQQQAEDYATVTRACLAVDTCAGITVWGISDKDSWVPGTFPGEGAACLWDENYQPKPAYEAVRSTLQNG